MGEVEAAKKVVALLFEMRVGLERGDAARKAAEAAMAKVAGRQDEAVQGEIEGVTKALEQARAAYQAAGVSGQEGLAAVAALEGEARAVLAQVGPSCLDALSCLNRVQVPASSSAAEGM
jgi:hypothetical protein